MSPQVAAQRCPKYPRSPRPFLIVKIIATASGFLRTARAVKRSMETMTFAKAIRRRVRRRRYAYTIGFYPDHAKWDGKFREVKLQLKSTVGQLRYRKGYFATPDQSADAQSAQALMQNAAASPIDATNLRMIVSGKRTDPPSSRKLELQVAIDPKQLSAARRGKRRERALWTCFFFNATLPAQLLLRSNNTLG